MVTGRVQGVFFRAGARERAAALGVSGWIRNRADGQVEGEVQGARQAVDSFARWLDVGPSDARIASVSLVPAEPLPAEVGFTIR